MATIGSKIELLKQTYSRRLEGGYMFNTDLDLTRGFRFAIVWFLLTDGEKRAVRSIEFRRQQPADFHVWQVELPERYKIASQHLLASLNRKHGGMWTVERIIGWAGGVKAVSTADKGRPTGTEKRR